MGSNSLDTGIRVGDSGGAMVERVHEPECSTFKEVIGYAQHTQIPRHKANF